MDTIPRRTNDVDLRTVARTMGATRVAIGSALVVLPGLSARGWLGDDSRRGSTKAVVRALGVRDALLGLGTIRALEQDEDVKPWLLAGALSDGIDAVGTVLAYRQLPKRRRFLAVAFMAGAAAAGVALAGQVDEG
jgi:sirohydrochlorin ferrochelatase